MRIPADLLSVQIVIIGKFEPNRFFPDQMVENGLIGPRDGEAADVRVKDDAIVDYSTEWCRIFVTPERFTVSSQQAPWIRLSDFCLKLFGDIVTSQSASYMGINRTVQFETGGLKVRDQLGKDLAPRGPWGEWGDVLDRDEGKGESGLSTMTMKQGHELVDRSNGFIEARVSPGPGSSVIVTVNDHYEAEEKDTQAGFSEFLKILESNFENSIKRSDWIVDQLMKRVNQ